MNQDQISAIATGYGVSPEMVEMIARAVMPANHVALPKMLMHEVLGALFNGNNINPEGFELIKQEFAVQMRKVSP